MDIQVKKLPKSQVQITIKVTKEEQAQYEEKALKDLAGKVKIDGFRPGKVPVEMVKEKVGQDAIKAEALEHALPELYYKAITEHKLQPIVQPKADIKKQDPWELVLTVDILPEIKLKDWKKIKLKKKEVKVEDKELQDMLGRLQAQMATFSKVERAAAKDDRVEIDFEGFIDGKPLAGGSSKNHPLVIGKSNFIPGFEEHLIGLKAGEEKEFEVTFPKDYHKEDLRSKPAKFKVKVHMVEEIKLPELNDDFAAKITGGNKKTIAELREEVTGHLKNQKESEEQRRLENEFLDQMAKGMEIDIPTALMEEELHYMRHEFEDGMSQYGLTMEKYLENQKKKEEDLVKEWTPEAEKRIKMRLGVQEIAKSEKVEVPNDELETRAKRLQAQSKDTDLETIKNRLYYAMRAEKAMEHIMKTLLK